MEPKFTYQFDFLGTSKTLDEAIKAQTFWPGAMCKGDREDVMNTLETLRSALRTLEIPPEDNFFAIFRAREYGTDWRVDIDPMTFFDIEQALESIIWPEQSFEPLHIKGDCNVDELSEDECNRLTSVGGRLDADYTENLSLPKLQSVGGDLDVCFTQDLTLPELASVGGILNAEESQNLSLPALQSVGGDLYVCYTQDLTLPALQSVEGNLNAEKSANLTLPNLQSVERHLYAWDSENLTIPFDLAMENSIPVECLSETTLEQGTSKKETKNQRTKPKI